MKPRSFADLYEKAEQTEEFWVAGAILELTEEVVRRMEEQRVSRSELARRLGTSPAYVTRLLRGNANLTLATMVRLARALESELHCHLTPAARAGRGSRAQAASRRDPRKPAASGDRPLAGTGAARPASRRPDARFEPVEET